MVTFINKNTRAKYAGDVLDNAPKNVQNGSVYFAMSEGKYYMYDAENDVWWEQADNGSGGGGEQVQPDWNQNDETKPDYIKNRIAYKTGNKVSVFDIAKSDVNFGPFDFNPSVFKALIESFPLISGEEYTVDWEGVTYKTTAHAEPYFGGEVVIGNVAIFGQPSMDTGEPFLYAAGFGLLTKQSGATHNISISHSVDEIVYLPDELISPEFKELVNQKTGKANLANGEIYNDYNGNEATGSFSHAEGFNTKATANVSHAEGNRTIASGIGSHSEGDNTTASFDSQHTQGKYNIDDPSGKYAHIVGNGRGDSNRSNAHTLDWDGNSRYQGSVLVAGTDMDAPDAELNPDSVVIKSSTLGSVKRFRITVTDDGVIKATAI